MTLAFWILLALVVYVYAGYPLLLTILRAVGGSRPVRVGSGEPPVTLIVSAFNEAGVIAGKLENCLALDYPRAVLQVIVVSDASDDGTDEVVAGFADRGVELLRMADRGGKTLGLNAAVQMARGEVVVFSDANAMYGRDVLRRLVRNFADPAVGAVVGESTYVNPEVESERSEGLYWRYETTIKRLESALGSVVGGDGAIYAIRRALYVPMRADALSDFVNPLQIVQAGHRCVYEPEARSYERAADNFDKEFRRKVRIVNRAWRALLRLKALLNPLRYGLFSFQLISHKLLRWLVPLFLASLFVVNLAVLGRHSIYRIALAGQLVFYLLAFAGYLARHRASLPALLSIPYYFCLVNLASALGILDAFRGKTYTTWATARTPGN
ncbi:MAG: glycosyltransferase family 2 protein [Gammaproteobacteria bacterium]|nr:glycosyltransferase family 2 protein [Gammaproteobacteria bacterium]